MAEPHLTVDLAKIEANARAIVSLCAAHRIAVVGVTKVTCGDPDVARAMVRGGVVGLGDSRLENLRRLRAGGLGVPLTLLRVPPLSEAEHVVELADVSLESERSVLAALAHAALARGGSHDVVLMVDLGDLREGLWPDDVLEAAAEVHARAGLRLIGLGTNLTCLGGVAPTTDNMGRLVQLVDAVERRLAVTLPVVSGGSSSALELIAAGGMPERVNQVRIGEAILLGRETLQRRPWPGTAQDAFVLHAEVIELKTKPSRPLGAAAQDAFGQVPAFADRGLRLRALLDVGREDVVPEGLAAVDPGIEVIGASSDYLAVDVSDAKHPVRLGDFVSFVPNYAALLAAMTSPYVVKRVLGGAPARAR